MTNAYEPRAIERRWQATWEAEQPFRTPNPGDADFDAQKPKYYLLDMFPYPSGAGLHVGHPTGYIGSDIVARKKRMEGFNVLHPMGFDAFGLPAEQYAIQTGKHPAETTAENLANYRRQLKLVGLSYDWTRELATCEPGFYRWTQWIFKQLWQKGLAYRSEMPVWWCEELKTVLANEEVINGRSERGGHPCVRRPLKQWMFRITEYAERLLAGLDDVEWPESVKTMQREWIGRSEGAEIRFPLAQRAGAADGPIEVFTTRPDTVHGATFMVLAPEHELVARITTPEQKTAVEAYVENAAVKSDLERTDLAKEKTGVFTGAYALNPLKHEDDPTARIPVWVADYVLISYGSGAIMAVPGHDDRDFEFARQYAIDVVEVVRPPQGQPGLSEGVCFTGDGTAVNSPGWDGLPTPEAKAKSIELIEAGGHGRAKVTYKLRDWLFSRQRYWGEPFPLIHRQDGTVEAVSDDALPIELPAMDDFTPSDDGSAPLARAKDWVETTDSDGNPAQRETDTMPGWAGSCWYYLRFMDPHNDEVLVDPEIERYWGAVDLYIGGVEHAVLHLLYARFWHHVLYDLGVVSTPEPFQRLFNQGMLTAFAYKEPSGRLVPADEVELKDDGHATDRSGVALEQVVAKMSKSLRNVVNPDDVIEEYGADTFRLYEMYMGPLGESKPWNPRDVIGCRRFLDRAWRMLVDIEGDVPVRPELLEQASGAPEGPALELERFLNRAIRTIDLSFTSFNFNTGIAGLMTFVNEATKRPGALLRSQAERFVLVLSPFAPHFGEELWQRLGHAGGTTKANWPEVDESMLLDDEIEIVVQVKGKVRGKVKVAKDAAKDAVEAAARDAVAAQLEGKEVAKTVVVPGRLVNFVVKG